MIITEMTRSECLELLASQRLGHLACCRDGQPYVVPVTFALDGNYLYSFSLTGQKIEWMRANPLVSLQTDVLGEHGTWRSVVVNGRFEELPDRIGWKHARDHAWSLLSQHANWWEPGGLKPADENPTPHVFYRIIIENLTGRKSVTEPD
jgi:nitroimidazol reductase NimA-like FMN-containing flavoprotein (pyridoxamine 5'-phosphate oxidase superfamily)